MSSRTHQIVTKVADREHSATKFQVVLVFLIWSLEANMDSKDLGGGSAEVENFVNRGIPRVVGLDSIEEIVGCDPLVG